MHTPFLQNVSGCVLACWHARAYTIEYTLYVPPVHGACCMAQHFLTSKSGVSSSREMLASTGHFASKHGSVSMSRSYEHTCMTGQYIFSIISQQHCCEMHVVKEKKGTWAIVALDLEAPSDLHLIYCTFTAVHVHCTVDLRCGSGRSTQRSAVYISSGSLPGLVW